MYYTPSTKIEMSTPAERGFDNQYDINASETIRQPTLECDKDGDQCANSVVDGFPYVSGTTLPCGFSNCGIPPQPFADQRAPMMMMGEDFSPADMQLAAERVMDGGLAHGYQYFEDPDAKFVGESSDHARHLTLTNDFNSNSIQSSGTAPGFDITQFSASDKFIPARSYHAPLVPLLGVQDPLLGQEASQSGESKRTMIILGVALGVGVLAGGGLYAYKMIKRRSLNM